MKRILIASLALIASQLQAVNPYMPLWEFIPDGEPYIFEDPDHPGQYRVYVYGSHDMLRDKYCGLDQVVWSAPIDDLSNWQYGGVIFESKLDANGKQLNADGKGDILYAPDIAVAHDANGKPVYYLYPNNQTGCRNGQIARSDRPDGPFTVCDWDAQRPDSCYGVLRFDPAVFVDDDGRVYGYWGFKQSNGAELDPTTMCTVKPGTKVVTDMISSRNQEGVFRFFEASSMRKIADKYVFIYSRVTADGEDGLPAANYNLAYAYSNNPLGPFTYGGTIIDGRGKEKRPDGSTIITANCDGNTHGSICKIGDQWWIFYHRQCGTSAFSRQAMVAPITVEVKEGPDGYVHISEAEYTSEGFDINGLDPLRTYAAGIACYYTNPEPQIKQYPYTVFPGPHPEPVYMTYDGKSDPYDPSICFCPMVNNTNGSVVGYKYFNFSKTKGMKDLNLTLNYTPEGTAGHIDIYLDRPNEAEGGTKLGSIDIPADSLTEGVSTNIPMDQLLNVEGKHTLFLVISSDTPHKSICQLNSLGFNVVAKSAPVGMMLLSVIGILLLIGVLALVVGKIRKKTTK